MRISYLKRAVAIGDATERFLCSRGLKIAIWGVLGFAVSYFGQVIFVIINR